MNKKIYDGGQAFGYSIPEQYWAYEDGMTLRDYFAAKATQEDIEKYLIYSINGMTFDRTREQAKFKYADQMLEAREAK